MDHEARCPYCFESVSLWVDHSGGGDQRYVEDCPVCCRPWQVVALRDEHGGFQVMILHQDA